MSKLHQIDDDSIVQLFFDRYYKDRGVVKWQGFYLSDHTAALKKQAKEEAIQYLPKEKQSLSELSGYLAEAFAKGKRVSIQLDTRDTNGEYQADIVGKLAGYQDDQIYMADHTAIDIEEIRHVEVL